MTKEMTSPIGDIAARILVLRGQRVLMDSDLAAMYGVSTRRFNEQVRRNESRFPADFGFVLTVQELANLKSQIATSSFMSGTQLDANTRRQFDQVYEAILGLVSPAKRQ